jgi:thermitase
MIRPSLCGRGARNGGLRRRREMGGLRRRSLLAAVLVLLAIAAGGARTVRAQAPASNVEGEILVRFRPGVASIAAADVHRQNGGQVKQVLSGVGVHVVTVPRGQEKALAAAYRRNPNVLFAEPNGVYRIFGAPNDPRVGEQWQYQNTGLNGGKADADIDAFQAWDITDGSPSVAIAILDTGIDQSHEDLKTKIARNVNFSSARSFDDDYGHGTHVAGSAAAATNNGIGVAGTCPKCALYNVRVIDSNGQGTWDQIAQGIIWAADNGAKVISMSLGGPDPSATLEAAVDYAWNAGAVVVAAAGNDGTTTQFYPAAYTHAIAVAATTSSDTRASFSNYGSWVDVAAPGENILSTAPDHANAIWLYGVKYGTLSGTSMATPHVAGVAGLVWSSGLCSDNACVRSRIETTADHVPGTGSDFVWGRVNACTAVGGACNAPSSNQPPTVSIVSPAAGSSVSGTVTIQIRATDAEDAAGALVVNWNVDGGAWTRATYNATTGYYEASWNSSSLTAGSHTLNAHVSDSAGAVATTSSPVLKDVDFTGRIAFGQSLTVTIPTANRVALVSFDGSAGQRFALRMTNVTIPISYVSVAKPDGTTLVSPTFAGTSGATIDATTLPVTGTYTILVDPYGTYTGSMTLTLYDVPPDITASISAGGAPVTVTTTAFAQNARLTFNGSAGQRISLKMTGVTMGSSTCCGVTVSIINPNGSYLVQWAYAGTNGGFVDTKTLPATGAYTIVVDPLDLNTGSMTLTLYDVPADATATATAGGSPATVTVAVPGQNARVSFNGTANQNVAVGISSVTIGTSTCCSTYVSILKPDGTALVTPSFYGTNGGVIDTRTLPVSGTYTIVVDPQGADTGSMTLTVFDVPADITATITAGGPSVTVSTVAARQNARVTFSGTAGQRVSVGMTGVAMGSSTCCGATVSILKPNGTTFVYPTFVGTNGGDIDTAPLPSSGTYTIFVDPQDTITGSITLTLSLDVTGTLTVGGAPVTLALDRAGQNGRVSFSGTAGQSVTVVMSGVTIGSSACCSVDVVIVKPDGYNLTTKLAGTSGGSFTVQLPATGTYQIVVDPWYAQTGSMTLSLAPAVSGAWAPDLGLEEEMPDY